MAVLPFVRNVGNRRLLEATTQTSSTSVTYTYFFDDPYNKAMYLVLPIMVLIYGGCGAIYCCAKLRRFAKRKRRQHTLEKSKENSDSTSSLVPFVIEEDFARNEAFAHHRPFHGGIPVAQPVAIEEKTTVVAETLADRMAKNKEVEANAVIVDAPPPYSPESKAVVYDSGYRNVSESSPLHLSQQPNIPNVQRSPFVNVVAQARQQEMRETHQLDAFHMPISKKKKRLVFIAI